MEILLAVACMLAFYLGFLCVRNRMELRSIYRQLEEVAAGSHIELTVSSRRKPVLALCRQLNLILRNQDSDQLRFRQAQKDLKQNITGLAHDIRTPLTVIRGYTEFLQKYVPQGKVTEEMLLEKLKTIHEQEERLFRFSATMATIQNMEKWEISGNWHEVSDLGEAMEDVLEGIRPGTGKEISLHVDSSHQQVFLDKNLLMEVFENLLNNGLRYARASIQVEMKMDGKELVLFVKDDGPGFSEKALRRGMEAYFSEEENSREHFGIGLSICRMLCENHGGSLSLQNSVTQGAIAAAALSVGVRARGRGGFEKES